MSGPAGPGTARHDRQRRIADWDQERLAAATAVVVGVGALGNEVAKNLGLLGIGRLVLCDPDTVTESNLSRTVLFGPEDLGAPKVGAAAAALGRTAPDTKVVARHDDLVHGVGLGELADAKVVLGCLDSRHARLSLLGRCSFVNAPLVDGGTHPWGGEIRLRLDAEQGCYSCTLSAVQRSEVDPATSCEAVLRPEIAPASIITTSIVAGWMTAAAVRVVLGEPVQWRFLDIDVVTGRAGPFAVERDPTCPHHEAFDAIEPVGVGRSATVRELLAAVPLGAEPLAWTPFALAGSCELCGRPYDGAAAGDARCPHCGGALQVRHSRQLSEADPHRRLEELRIASGEVLAVRLSDGGYRWLRLTA